MDRLTTALLDIKLLRLLDLLHTHAQRDAARPSSSGRASPR